MASFNRAALPAARRRVDTSPSQRNTFFRQRYVDLTNEDDELGEGIAIESSAISSQRQPQLNFRVNQLRRNGPITSPRKEVESVRINGLQLAVEQTVEIQQPLDEQTAFLCIKHILKDTKTGKVTIRGSLFRRVRTLQGMLTDHDDEVVMIREIDEDDTRPKNHQAMVDVPLEHVIRQRSIELTNELYSRRTFMSENDRVSNTQWDTAEQKPVLICRYIYTEHYLNAADRQKNQRCTETVLRRLYQHEISDGLETGLNQMGSRSPATFLGKRLRSDPSLETRPFTYGSGCAGCGGDSTGAALAKFKTKFAWDQNGAALRTLLLNHSDTDAYETEATNFLEGNGNGLERAICDLLHLSWPCPYFSPAHTKPGKDDEANIRAMFGTVEHLKASGALIHTQENTYGLLTHHPAYFCLLIEMISRAGYNVRWKILQLRDFGIAQSRQRLIIIASKEGVPTPHFPKPTHGPPGSDLIPYQMIHDVISRVPIDASWHLIAHKNYKPIQPFKIPKKPYDATRAYARCITTSGGKNNYHPSGLRGFTPRELARIQGFPMDYQFHDSCMGNVRKQVGNAIPPLAWVRIMESCYETLRHYSASKKEEEEEEEMKSKSTGRVDSPFSVTAKDSRKCVGLSRSKREASPFLSPDLQPQTKKRRILVDLTDGWNF